jgi:hypothetical protein
MKPWLIPKPCLFESPEQEQARLVQNAPDLSEWERNFLFGVRTQTKKPLSPRQRDILTRIVGKVERKIVWDESVRKRRLRNATR